MKYRFVGSLAENHGAKGHRIERLGHPIEFTDEEAIVNIGGGQNFIPDADFEALGFTKEELRKHSYHGQRLRAPAAFQAKLLKAQDIFRELYYKNRKILLARADPPAATESAAPSATPIPPAVQRTSAPQNIQLGLAPVKLPEPKSVDPAPANAVEKAVTN